MYLSTFALRTPADALFLPPSQSYLSFLIIISFSLSRVLIVTIHYILVSIRLLVISSGSLLATRKVLSFLSDLILQN